MRRAWLQRLAEWWPAAALVPLMLAAPLLTRALHRTAPSGSYVEASGYGAIVAGLLAPRGWLVGDAAPANDLTAAPVVQVGLSAPDAFGAFYSHSYLAEDILANNPALWTFADGRLAGVDPTAHRLPRPFADQRIWRGDLDYATAAAPAPVLAGDGLELEPQPPAPFALARLPASIAYVDLDASGPQAARAQIVRARVHGRIVASFWLVGDEVVVRAIAAPEVETVIAGRLATPSDEGAGLDALGPGQDVVFRLAGGGERRLRLSQANTSLSRYLPFSTPDRAFAGAPPALARPFADAMNYWMAADPNVAEGLASLKVTTTLDGPLNAAAQTALAAEATGLAGEVADASFRSAATIMDARTGDILALASSTGDAPSPRNQNFVRLPIGSAAKIPFAAAILNWSPRLATLKLASASAPLLPSVLGVDLCSPAGCRPMERARRAFHEEAVGIGRIGFCSFIQHSSNKYGTALLLLASSPDPFQQGDIPSGEPFDLGGASGRTRLPPLMFPYQGRDDGGALVGPPPLLSAQLGWIGQLSQLFDLPLVERTSAPGDTRDDIADYDLAVWGGLLGEHRQGISGFKQISPERESFALNTVADLRNDYLTLILGGGRSRWSTVKLAEVFARVVMNRPVRANLFQAQPPPQAAWTPLRDDVRAELLAGMRAVPATGTARTLWPQIAALQARLPMGEEIRVFAKTGTPTIAEQARSSANQAADFLMRQRQLTLGADGRLRPAFASNAVALAHWRADPLISARLASLGLTAQAALAALSGQSEHAVRSANRALSLDPDVAWTHDGGVFAFVIGRYRAGAPDGAPERAYAVAINMQQRVAKGPNTSIAVARRLISGALGDALVAGASPAGPRAPSPAPPICKPGT